MIHQTLNTSTNRTLHRSAVNCSSIYKNCVQVMLSLSLIRIMRVYSTLALAALVLGLSQLYLVAQQQFQGVCANVKIEILQELALERIGFEATLEVTNNGSADPLTDFLAALTFRDPSNLDENGAPRDASHLFFVQAPRMTDITGVNGDGVIGPTKTAIIRWFIIPKPTAGGTLPQGKRYEVGVNMSAKLAGEIVPKSILYAIPDTITVKPEPQLEITYFQPRDVQGDDPFTQEVESPIPFTLGVLVKNSGYGPARNVRIDSQQPKIVENSAGLLLIARLIGTRVMDSALDSASLRVDLGTLEPGQTRKGAWDMITSLSGEFIEFKASYTHAAELGGLETSLIKSLEAHFIAAEVLNNDPGRDNVKDFLADTDRDSLMLPDTLYESEGQVLPVNHWADSAITSPLADRTFTVTTNAHTEGWGYIRLDDPGQAKLKFQSVVRNDGKKLNLNNIWTNIRYRETDNAKLTYLNIFDKAPSPGVYSYTITYQEPAPDNTPPQTQLRFAGQVTHSGGVSYVTTDTQMYFTSVDDSPVSIFYKFDDDDNYRNGLPFRILTPGTYGISYYAVDSHGNEEAPKTAVLVLLGGGPVIADLGVESDSLTLTGAALSFREKTIGLNIDVGASNVDVDAKIDVFRGIRVWPQLIGVPVSPTPATTTTLWVTGENVDYYRFRLGNGEWSSERSVSTPINLTELSGQVSLSVLARSQHGSYPPVSESLLALWEVNPSAPDFSLAGLPPTPTRYAPGKITVSGSGMSLFRWKPNNSFFRAEAPLGTEIEFPLGPVGLQTLSLLAKIGTEWQDDSDASTVTWRYDPTFGSDMSSLPLVYSETRESVQGANFQFAWDGRSNGGVLQQPGWYTIRIMLQDELGKISFVNQLVKIEELASAPTVIADVSAGAEKPHARGDWLVWQQRDGGTPNIHAQHVGDPGATPFSVTSLALAQENPRTDGRYVVWQGSQENGTTDIFIADLSTPDLTEPVTSTPVRNEVKPVVDWPWVVYQSKDASNPSAPWQLEAKNLETGQHFMVDPTSKDQLDPALHAGRVVWQDFRDPGFGEIYFRNLETGEQCRITNSTFGQYFPDIDGNWIVWQDNRHTQVEIYGHDLRNSREVRLTQTQGNETRPRLSGNWVLFQEDSTGSENFAVLDLGSMVSAPLTLSPTPKSNGVIAGGRLYWQRGPSGSSVIESAATPALQPVFHNFNAVAVTEALVDTYGDAFSLLEAWQEDAGVESVSRFAALSPLTVQTATWNEGLATGENFTLSPGQFLWVRFGSDGLVDLGSANSDPIDLPAGVSAFSHTRIPLGMTGHGLIRSLGEENVLGLRILDSQSGRWQLLSVRDGVIHGADFPVPSVAVVLVELVNPVSGWRPSL